MVLNRSDSLMEHRKFFEMTDYLRAGAAFLVIANLLARILLAPVIIPIGVITAIIGAPFFIYLLRHTRKGYAF